MKWLRTSLYVLFLGACTALGVGLHVASKVVSAFGPDATLSKILIAGKDPLSYFPNQKRMTILLVGQDYNHNNKGFIYTRASRADTVMLLSVDLAKKSVRACSIPRDTYVKAPDGKTGKINATFSRGGIDLLKGTIKDLFGVEVDHYVVIKPTAVREIVDSVGGVEVEAIDDMNYDDNWGGLHIHLPAGKQVVDGKGAEGFVRFREVNRSKMDADGHIIPLHNVKSSKEEGDLRRTARQQQMVHALMLAANTPGNIMHADQIIDTGFNQIETDLSRLQCLALANIFRGSAGQQMVSGTLPGGDKKLNGVYFYVLDDDRAQATVDWLINYDDEAIKKTLRIVVTNGTKTPGAASKVAKLLNEKGFNATVMGNAPAAAATTVVYQKASYFDMAKQIQGLIGSTNISKAPPSSPANEDIAITIGQDTVQVAEVPGPSHG
ncbi:MAG: LCP family protein [Armatimonadetes bacterium]|nr:LCP family protein [Armatimonadota bacterium]MBS1727327.1 LCP family protein [Armatimonadota bacterium]